MAKVERKDIRTLFWRSLMLQSAFSFERMQALGFVYAFLPLFRKLYTAKESLAKALTRHLTFFNTMPYLGSTIIGITASMEEKLANGKDIDESAISGIKGALMGPFAGIGDSIFQGTLRPICAGIAISFALEGSALGPILFLLLVNIPHFLVRWFGLTWGYNLGETLIEKMQGLQLKRWLDGANMVGLMVIGALVATWVNISTPLVYNFEETAISLQTTLDSIVPRLLPLLFTLGVLYGLRKKLSSLWIMAILIVIGVVGGYFGILG